MTWPADPCAGGDGNRDLDVRFPIQTTQVEEAMPLQDGTPREKYNEPRDANGRPGRSIIHWPTTWVTAFVVLLLLALLSAYQGWNDRTATNSTPGPELNTQSSKQPADVPQPAQ